MGGVVILTACGTDAFEDSYPANDSATTSNENGGMTTFSNVPGLSGNYLSPWDITFNTDPVLNFGNAAPIFYKFENKTGDWGSPHLLTLRVTPYVGLAYFDGTDDGDYYGYNITVVPNLFANGSEIGNFIAAQSFDIDGTGIPAGGTVQLDIRSSTDHCPVVQNTLAVQNPNSIYFDVSGTVAPTTFEENLLKDYGKVFYYKIEVFDPANMLVFESYMMPDNNYVPDNLYWNLTGVDHITPTGNMVPMVYNFDRSNNSTLSDEIVLDKASIPGGFESEMTFPYLMWNMKVTVKTDPFGMYVKLDDF